MRIRVVFCKLLIVAVAAAAQITVCNANTPTADLQISGGVACNACEPGPGYLAGGGVMEVSNSGPDDAIGASFDVVFPPPLSCAWSCVPTGQVAGSCTPSLTGPVTQSGFGDIHATLALPNGTTAQYTVTCSTPSSFGNGSMTEYLSVTATVSPPNGVNDPNPLNNTTVSQITLTPRAFALTMSVSDGVSTVAPGGAVTYTITAANFNGPSDVVAVVGDAFPAAETCTWTCAASPPGTCTPSGSGNIDDIVYLPAYKTLTYTAQCAISDDATGTLSNGAVVSDAGDTPGSAIDTDTVLPLSDLGISVVHGANAAVPGASVAYAITASNAGPGDAPGSSVLNAFPPGLSCNWTCAGAGGGTCTAGGNGNIADTVSLPAGSSAVYTASCAIPSAATGTLNDTASAATGSASADLALANNSATDTEALTSKSDVAVTLFSDSRTYVQLNDVLTYVILVSNAIGPSDASVTVQDTLPPWLSGGVWACVASPSVTCSNGVSQVLNATVALPAGTFVEYIYSAHVSGADASEQITNSVSVGVLSGIDPVPANNSASDTDTLVIFRNGFDIPVN